jgi:tRNA A-37 threonylcarbamoyl transferase component Bud32
VSNTTAIDVGGAGERYEAAWNASWSLDTVNRFLEEGWPAADAEARRGLLAEFAVRDLDLHLQHGDPVSAADYLHRYPDLRADPDTVRRLREIEASRRGRSTPGLPVVPGYEILGELGKGGMGVVYKARQSDLDRHCALKMILASEQTADETLARFHTEAEAIARLQHPNIVQVFQVGDHQGRPFLALEFCPGGTLEKKLAGTPLLPREAAALVRTLAEAMQAAHQANVIHRDLKPANVLLAADGTPKVTDFGLARKLDDRGQTRTGAILGTPSYMAPEQAAGRKEVGPSADVYALGVILYECLTGRPPFKAAEVYETLTQVIANDPVPPRRLNPQVPADLETICLKCLHKVPARRYATARELADDLGRFLEGRPIQARPVGYMERTWRLGRRHPWAAAFGLAVVSGGLATCILWYIAAANAVQARESAERARAETLQHLIASAQNRLARGLLGQAEEDYDQALAIAAEEEQRPIQVQRLRCLFAFGRWDRLRAELERLSACPDLTPQQRAEVLLHQGDLDLWQTGDDRQRRGLDRLRQAVALDALAPADQAYARGLLAEGPKTALAAFEEAVLADGYHLRANAALLLELCFNGQFDQARRRARFMQAAFPREPVVPYGLAAMATLEDDQPARRRHRDELARLVDPVRMPGLDEALRVLEAAVRFRLSSVGGAARDPTARVRAAWKAPGGLLGGLAGLFRPSVPQVFRHEGVGPAVGIGSPLLRRPQKLVEDLGTADWHLGQGQLAEAEKILVAAGRERSESLLYFLMGRIHIVRGREALERGDGQRWIEEYGLAHEQLARAVDAPAVVSNDQSQRMAAWGWLLLEAPWAWQSRRTRALTGCTTVLAGQPLLALVPLLHGQNDPVSLPPPADGHILRRLLEPSRGPDPDRAQLLPGLVYWMDPDEARYLLFCWRRDEPGEVKPYQVQAKLELWYGNPRGALDWVQRGLAIRRGDAELRKLEGQARAALSPAVPPPPTSSRPGG